MDDLVEREGLYYQKNTDVPFTGEVKGSRQGQLKDGLKHGSWIAYCENGQLHEEFSGTYKYGKKVD